ncbi:MAG: hypothetical protein NE327_09235 [Lentisphaeraceae bacterium]|nr:hypothetical protein [Lentisphaeraceae bacterium]
MNANQFNRRARRAARKQGIKLGRPLSPEEVKKLKVQTAPLWAQVTLIIVGLASIFGGVYAQMEHENIWLCVILSLFGLGLFLFGVFGKKDSVENVAGEFIGKPVEAVIETILNPLKLLDF